MWAFICFYISGHAWRFTAVYRSMYGVVCHVILFLYGDLATVEDPDDVDATEVATAVSVGWETVATRS